MTRSKLISSGACPRKLLLISPSGGKIHTPGEVAEWSNAADSKSVDGSNHPRVRIPPSPFKSPSCKVSWLSALQFSAGQLCGDAFKKPQCPSAASSCISAIWEPLPSTEHRLEKAWRLRHKTPELLSTGLTGQVPCIQLNFDLVSIYGRHTRRSKFIGWLQLSKSLTDL